MNTFEPNKENIVKNTEDVKEYQYCNELGTPVFRTKMLFPKEMKIIAFLFSINRERGVVPRKTIQKLEFIGWKTLEDLPSDFRKGNRVSISSTRIKPLVNFLISKFKNLESLKIVKDGRTRFSEKTITFNWNELDNILRSLSKEKRFYETRRKNVIHQELSELTSKVEPRRTKLGKNDITKIFALYEDNPSMSDDDVETVLSLLTASPTHRVSVTENFIQTKDKINLAYLDDVLKNYEKLMSRSKDNEKEWQTFFEKHGWILNNLFPYQVIMHEREAYVGGKTIQDKNGRVVDFLFHNGFEDNYALLEIKTHKKNLLKKTPYRKPDAYAMTDDLSGAISQCLDQKNVFIAENGKTLPLHDPKVILLIGQKSELSKTQSNCFELIRANQKNIDIVTFDELHKKIEGLMSVLKQ